MNENLKEHFAYVLIHSPLVGPLTWELVCLEMQQRGLEAITPTLSDDPQSILPFWEQHAESVAHSLRQIPPQHSIVLVAHSGAGPLLPAIRQSLDQPIHAYLFVDAGIPHDNFSRLDLMKWEDPEWADSFQQTLTQGKRYPTWNASDLQEIIPDAELRQRLVAEINPRSLPFFTEPIPVFDGWPDAPCAYIQFSAAYDRVAAHAQQAGWSVQGLNAGHFHMLVNPAVVADTLVTAVLGLPTHESD